MTSGKILQDFAIEIVEMTKERNIDEEGFAAMICFMAGTVFREMSPDINKETYLQLLMKEVSR